MPAEITSTKTLLLSMLVLAGYLVFMFANPARGSMRDGLRCVQRYPRLWTLLAVFGLFHALFMIGVDVFLYYTLPEQAPGRPLFFWHRAWVYSPIDFQIALHHAVLPAMEMVTGVFNTLVTTFPFSALAALLFLFNWRQHHGTFRRALIRRFRGLGALLYAITLLCALAAIVKPLTYFALPLAAMHGVPGYPLLEASLFVDWLSFLFETAFGVCVQIYLILLAYAWVRGVNFTHQHLLDFAIRRFSAAMKWTGVIMLMSTLTIHLPLILSSLGFVGETITTQQVFDLIRTTVRPAIVFVLCVFCSMQIVLVFHGETLREAFGHHLSFLKRQAWPLLWFIAAALLHAWLLNVVDWSLRRGLGEETAYGIAWQLAFPLIAALLMAWILASWVCLFQRWEKHRSELEPLVRF